MYNCIQSHRRLPYAADRGRFYAVQLETFKPRMFFVPYTRILFDHHTVQRHVDRADLRFLTKIAFRVFRSVSVGKTYRHLRPGGIASGARVVSQKNYVSVTETGHVFDCAVAESDHSLTK